MDIKEIQKMGNQKELKNLIIEAKEGKLKNRIFWLEFEIKTKQTYLEILKLIDNSSEEFYSLIKEVK